MKLTLEIDVEKYKWSLVGDGYLCDEVKEMNEDQVIEILQRRLSKHINEEYEKSLRIIPDELIK